MFVGVSKIDITPEKSVAMAGMLRAHGSDGVHDKIYARALVLSNSMDLKDAYVIVTVDICGVDKEDTDIVRQAVSETTGIPFDHFIIAATHTHSGPATIREWEGFDREYTTSLTAKLIAVIEQAASEIRPASLGCGKGLESTVSHYRRLMADDGHIVMNWEPYPAEHLIGPAGEVDAELGIMLAVEAGYPMKVISVLFNHAGHPNVLSGDNYLISADYPGRATELLDLDLGGISMYLNGAQGTMDIDGLKDRDFEGLERIGTALASAVTDTVGRISVTSDAVVRGGNIRYTIPPRKLTDSEIAWAEAILSVTGGKIEPVADGVGDDYKAVLYKGLHANEESPRPSEHVCISIGDTAFISCPGELFTEIGMRIKKESPFANTFIIGLANDYIGYVPSHEAIAQGGYEVDTRQLADDAEDLIVEHSLRLLNQIYHAG